MNESNQPATVKTAKSPLVEATFNEHVALCAVAKLASEIEERIQKINFSSPTFVQVDALNSSRGFMREALANLAAIRGGK